MMAFDRLICRLWIGLLFASSTHGVARAQCVLEFRDLNPEVPAHFTACCVNYGVAVATNGEISLIGNQLSYVTVVDNSSGEIIQTYMPDDVVSRDGFGESIAIHENTAVIGAFEWDSTAFNTGTVYVYDLDTHEMRFQLFPVDHGPFARYGSSVAVDDRYIIVGAYYENAVGAVYIHDAKTGELMRKIPAPRIDALESDFGFDVEFEGDILAISAPKDDSAGWHAGAVFIYRISTGELLRTHLPSVESGILYGRSIAVEDDALYVGDFRATVAGLRSGAVHAYRLSDGEQLATLVPGDAAHDQEFGFSVAVRDGLLAVGSVGGHDAGFWSGAAYAFDTSTYAQRAKMIASDTTRKDRFGGAVAVSGSYVIVGADDGGFNFWGKAYQYEIPEERCLADSNADGSVDFFDVLNFIASYNSSDSAADLASRCGRFDSNDVAAFLDAYALGCQ